MDYRIELLGQDRVAEAALLWRDFRRRAYPALPPLTDHSPAQESLAAGLSALAARCGPGAVAALDRSGRVAGFLAMERREDSLQGRHARAPSSGWAFAEDAPAKLLGSLYAAAGEAALQRGCLLHQVMAPSSDRASLDSLFALGFGLEQVYALAPLESMERDFVALADVEIRRAAPGDEELLEGLSHLIAGYQAGPPVWAAAPEDYLHGLREGYRGLATEQGIILLALRGEEALGFQAWFPAEASPEDGFAAGEAWELSVGAVLPKERGAGLARALTAAAARAAAGSGARLVLCDWRSANPLSAAFWPARGFVPFRYRLVRRLDPAALWARGE